MNKAKKLISIVEQEPERTLPGTSGDKDPYPKIVRSGLDRYHKDPRPDWDASWIWFHSSSQQDKDEFEKYLIDTKDPLSFEAGNPFHRYIVFMNKLIYRLQEITGGSY